MKISRTKVLPSAVIIAAAVLGGGAYYVAETPNLFHNIARAYTSTVNTTAPSAAQDDYEVTFPDEKLKAALNKILATTTGTSRNDTDALTYGDLKKIVKVSEANSLNNKGITNLEGIQYLTNATVIQASGNKITDVTPLEDLPKVTSLVLTNNKISDITPLARMAKLIDLSVGVNDITNLAPLENMPNLEIFHMEAMRGTGPLDISPVLNHSKLRLLNINSNGNRISNIASLASLPNLQILFASKNNIVDLSQLKTAGKLNERSTFADQAHSITTDTEVFANPVKDIDGNPIPVVETAKVKNANQNGDLNPQGAYLKLIDATGTGRTTATWSKEFPINGGNNTTFSGTLTINYNIPAKDTEKPTFNPSAPNKIVARKGTTINLNDVQANDNVGLNAQGVTNNAAAVNLDPANPAAGTYVVQYSATDTSNNTATVNRDVEITNADDLTAKIASTKGITPGDYTADTANTYSQAKTKAEQIVAQADATQAAINDALQQLTAAINGLRVDKSELNKQITQLDSEPDYIKNDPAVAAKKAAAQTTAGEANPTNEAVTKAVRELREAVTTAKDAEATRQRDAEAAVAKAETDKRLSDEAALTNQVNAVKDPAKQLSLKNRLAAVKQAVTAKKTELGDAIKNADDAKLDGRTADSTQQLAQAKANATALRNKPDASVAELEAATTALKNALAGLKTDKKPLTDALATFNAATPEVKADKKVSDAKLGAEAVNQEASPTVDAVRTAAKKLTDALAAAAAAANQPKPVTPVTPVQPQPAPAPNQPAQPQPQPANPAPAPGPNQPGNQPTPTTPTVTQPQASSDAGEHKKPAKEPTLADKLLAPNTGFERVQSASVLAALVAIPGALAALAYRMIKKRRS